MSHRCQDATATSTNVHVREGHRINLGFTDHSDSAVPFHTLKLEAGDHTLNVFFMHHGGPSLTETLQHIIESATAQLEQLNSQAWVNAIEELSTKVDG